MYQLLNVLINRLNLYDDMDDDDEDEDEEEENSEMEGSGGRRKVNMEMKIITSHLELVFEVFETTNSKILNN